MEKKENFKTIGPLDSSPPGREAEVIQNKEPKEAGNRIIDSEDENIGEKRFKEGLEDNNDTDQ